ncbi:MAG: hypothetical protein MMC23_002735 [Stictis urceolatum]|nr:hypothetical protein [Stictis urceolata]
MTNLDMNAISNSQWSSVNTDGTDTWNSRDIVISNWTNTSGGDCITVRSNSTNIYVSNIVCYESGVMVISSLCNPALTLNLVDNVVFENISLTHSSNAAWMKTYLDQGYVRNATFRNINFNDIDQPVYVSSCIDSY